MIYWYNREVWGYSSRWNTEWPRICSVYTRLDHSYASILRREECIVHLALREWMLQAWMRFTQLLVWIKDSAIIGRLDYLPQHELIAYGWYGKHAFYGWKAKSILPFARVRKNTIHPTMKPIPLLRELILNSSKRGDTVYDPFGGSWSTLIASEQTGRKCVTVEINPVYCRAIIKRWEDYTGKLAEKIT